MPFPRIMWTPCIDVTFQGLSFLPGIFLHPSANCASPGKIMKIGAAEMELVSPRQPHEHHLVSILVLPIAAALISPAVCLSIVCRCSTSKAELQVEA